VLLLPLGVVMIRPLGTDSSAGLSIFSVL
jgi:hypothetical protein